MAVAKVEGFDPTRIEVESESKFKRKFKESPFMVFGLAGCVGAVAYGAYTFRQRKIRPSIFLMQLRVGAQGMVVGMLTLGVGYQLFQRLTGTYVEEHPYDDESNKPKN